jgi:cysteine desulfurase
VARFAYLDCAASTPMRPSAIAAMGPFLRDRFGNPSGGHAAARDARAALEDAREAVAAALGAGPHDVVFTSGGTEADNLAVRGVVGRRGGVAVCPATEHHAVLDPVRHLGGRVVPVLPSGRVDLDALAASLGPEVSIVSVMAANNETGVIEALDDVAAVVRAGAPDAVFHTDAVQAVCWTDVAAACRVADLVSVSAHKFGGPKGTGVLVVRPGVELEPLLLGGGQEEERRGGTHNVAGAVALADALTATVADRSAAVARVAVLRDQLEDGLVEAVPGLTPTSERSIRTAGMCHVVIEGIVSEMLLLLLEEGGVLASAAASCASGAMEPSHVLAAMGYAREQAQGSLRLSLGHETQEWEVDRVLDVLTGAVARLRRPAEAALS